MENQGDWSEIKVGQGKRILVVDDDTTVRLTLDHYLQWDGYEVFLAGDGREALSIMQTEAEPDLIILDLSLPDRDGFAVAHEIRKRSNVPIVALSAITETDTKIGALIEFAHDYVTKPFHVEEVATRVYRILAESAKGGIQKSDAGLRNDANCKLGGIAQSAVVDRSPDGHRRYNSKSQIPLAHI